MLVSEVSMPLEPGQMLSHYRLVEQIGKGGMGVVWKALDTRLDREVAIKALPDDFADNPERLRRFEREAKLLASLNHANIATVHGLEDSEGDQDTQQLTLGWFDLPISQHLPLSLSE